MWFQSTHSLRSATAYTQVPRTGEIVSIHALLAECDFFWLLLALFRVVSIHALLAECDAGRQVAFRPVHRFNPRTPCGVRPQDCPQKRRTRLFQSTHSLRSATVPASCPLSCSPFQSTHSLRSATRAASGFSPCPPFQSTHSLRSATRLWLISRFLYEFQSTHSLRSATKVRQRGQNVPGVSIHALLAECDGANP